MDTITKDLALNFLLGKFPEARRQPIEESFVVEQKMFEELLQAETQLIDDYVAGRLSRSDSVLFERVVLPRTKDKVNFARALAAYSVRKEQWDRAERPVWTMTIGRWFSSPSAFAYLAVAGVLLIAVGLWIFRTGVEEQAGRPDNNMIAEGPRIAPASPSIATPADDLTPPTDNSVSGGNNSQNDSGHTRASRPVETKSSRAIIATINLTPISRGGSAAAIPLSQKDGLVRLRLPPEAGQHVIYSIRVETVDGRQISQQRVKVRPGTITATLPRASLTAGDYIVTLKGIGRDGSVETLNEYSFTIK